jgi:hypothetical protein|tara:strand:+ start:700 stop:876 length:177 start_codon:yes stop_codon:yes gene_type:complete
MIGAQILQRLFTFTDQMIATNRFVNAAITNPHPGLGCHQNLIAATVKNLAEDFRRQAG